MRTTAGGTDAALTGASADHTAEQLPRREQMGGVSGSLRSVNPAAAILLVAAALAIVYGVVLRVWLLAELPIWGDEAIVGIMARAIDGGHFTAFYWGQHYGGLEPYLVALGLKVGGGGEPALNGTPALLAAVGAVLVGGVTFAASRSRVLAVGAAGAVWVWPYVVIWQSVREGGFRETTLCCGLAALWCCIRAYRRRAGSGTFLALGVALGLGFWASPEILYFALPCLVLLVAWWSQVTRLPHRGAEEDNQEPTRSTALLLVLGGGIVGSIPWWWANAHTSFASIRSSSLPANGGATYGERLSVFFHYMLPMQLGVRTVMSGEWVGGPVGRVLYVVLLALVIIAAAWAAWVAVTERSSLVPLAVALGVVAYPFLYAGAPGTAYWNDGRYGIYFPALVVVLFATALGTLRGREHRHGEERMVRRGALAVAALGVLGALCLTVAGARTAGVPATFFTSWHNGDVPMEHVVNELRTHHITDAYGDYWTAYDLDFLSGGSPAISPSPLDVVRSTDIAAQVATSKDPAWLFFAPNQTARAATVFLNPQPGPGPYTEQTFEAHLKALGVPYRVVHLGVLDAVLPARRLSNP